MKMLCSIMLMIAFFSIGNAQTKTFEAIESENKALKKNKCKIYYDKFKDVTVVTTDIGSTKRLAWVQGSFGFDGQILNKPIEYYTLYFTTITLMKDTTLIFIVNNERIKIGEAIEQNQPNRFLGISGFTHKYIFTTEQLEKFVSSEEVEFQLGNLNTSTIKHSSEKLKNLLILSKLN